MNTDHPGQILNLQRRKVMATLVGLAATVSLEPRTAIAAAKEPRPLQPAAPQSAGARGLALVLGGGCHRALAHVGVIKVLEANGIVPDLIVGASAGSMVGALYASGLRAAALEKAAAALGWDAIQKFDLSRFAFYSSDPLRAFINQAVGGRKLEELPIRFAALAADLHTGAPHLFERGEAGLAVQASSSAPGVFQPTRVDGRTYIDGGIASPVPVSAARRLGAKIVIGVNVSFPPAEAQLRNVVDVVMQAFTIATHQLVRRELALADVALVPKLPQLDDMSFDNHPAFIAAGERAALLALPAIRKALSGNKMNTKPGDQA